MSHAVDIILSEYYGVGASDLFTKEVNPWLAKRALKTNGRLANLELTSFVKEATNASTDISHKSVPNLSMYICILDTIHKRRRHCINFNILSLIYILWISKNNSYNVQLSYWYLA